MLLVSAHCDVQWYALDPSHDGPLQQQASMQGSSTPRVARGFSCSTRSCPSRTLRHIHLQASRPFGVSPAASLLVYQRRCDNRHDDLHEGRPGRADLRRKSSRLPPKYLHDRTSEDAANRRKCIVSPGTGHLARCCYAYVIAPTVPCLTLDHPRRLGLAQVQADLVQAPTPNLTLLGQV